MPWAGLLVFSGLLSSPLAVADSGGPDSYGYEWKDSNELDGPALEWLDISMTGELVIGLADDNSVGPIQLPKPFRYYWIDVSSLRIGSNGWVGFYNTSDITFNIASCFPDIPTPGGAGDTFLAPLLSDLTFAGAGNPGTARYHYDAVADVFVVSYSDLPFWVNTPDGYDSARNTFQIVLDYSSNQIRFNYQQVDPFNDGGCLNDMGVGIEAPQGQIGLQHSMEVVLSAPLTIEFTPPDTPLISIVDSAPVSGIDPDNRAVIRWNDAPLDIGASISNSGNGDGVEPIQVNAELFDSTNGNFYSNTLSLAALNSGESVNVDFPPIASQPVGLNRLELSTNSTDDYNAANNLLLAEVLALDSAEQVHVLAFSTAPVPNGSINWASADASGDEGLAVYFPGVGEPVVVRQIGAVPVNDVCGTYRFQLVDDDGEQGLPGTVLAGVDVGAGNYSINAWNDFPLASPVLMDGSGFYVVWRQIGSDCSLGTSSETPSRRNFELISGTFSGYRANVSEDVMLRATVALGAIFSDGLETTPP